MIFLNIFSAIVWGSGIYIVFKVAFNFQPFEAMVCTLGILGTFIICVSLIYRKNREEG
jgi:hypothetical protein